MPKTVSPEKLNSMAKGSRSNLPFSAGEKIPEDFPNPPVGEMGHYCMDPEGRYRPDFMQLKLHGSKNMPSRQFFSVNKKSAYVRVGKWVDVPRFVITALSMTEIEKTHMDYDGTDLVLNDFVPKVVERVPRFAYSVFPSA